MGYVLSSARHVRMNELIHAERVELGFGYLMVAQHLGDAHVWSPRAGSFWYGTLDYRCPCGCGSSTAPLPFTMRVGGKEPPHLLVPFGTGDVFREALAEIVRPMVTVDILEVKVAA